MKAEMTARKVSLDTKPANESTEYDDLRNAVCKTIRTQDVTHIARKSKTADIYRSLDRRQLGVRWYEYFKI